MSNTDLELSDQSRVVIRVPSASDLSETALETTDLGTTIQLPETIGHSQQGDLPKPWNFHIYFSLKMHTSRYI